MRLTGEEVEQAFVATAREQVNGEPFNWQRCADHLNERLTDQAYARRAAFLLGPRPTVGVDGAATKATPAK